MTNKSFFYKQKSHINQIKHGCRCEDVMEKMSEEIENLKTIIEGYKDELKKVERYRTV